MSQSLRIQFVIAILPFLPLAEGPPIQQIGPGAPVSELDAAAPAAVSAPYSAEFVYAEAVQMEQVGDTTCVDLYYQAATLAWPEIERQIVNRGKPYGRVGQVYQNSLRRLIVSGQRFCRLDPSRGLDIHTADGVLAIPIRYHGFPWKPSAFEKLVLWSHSADKHLNNWYRWSGLGVATVVSHDRHFSEPFQRKQHVFAASVVLRPIGDGIVSAGQFVLEFVDPLRVTSLSVGGTEVEIVRDLTAPLSYILARKDKNVVKQFLNPGTVSESGGLLMLEPYQPGKIPVIFVHGLLSDPYTWANVANELRARPELFQRYQIWGFEYATGEPFLKSAALFREQLLEIQFQFDPTGTDEALSKMVLVGHSMGGLISKLQITHSGDYLWNSVSCRPLDQITTSPATRNRLSHLFHFEPSPSVKRVVFIGTPHRGSPWARRPAGRFGAKLIEQPSTMKEIHQQLQSDNPGVFSREFRRRIPASIDLLRPDSNLLLSMNCLPHDESVPMHSIIGSGYRMIGARDSDRAVPVWSARIPRVVSEKFVHAKHTKLHGDPVVIDEVFCILRQHLLENGR